MYPLLEIKTVPIELQMKTTSASIEYKRGTAEMEISRSEQGAVNVKSRPIQVRLDTFERSAPAQAGQAVEESGGSYQATSAYADQGQLTVSARIGHQAAQAVQAVQSENGYQQPSITPKSGMSISWEDGSMEIRYAMDKLNFDWKIDQGEFKFTPGDIEISVAQRPSITIRYTGGPIYVPRSADPNYEPVDVKA